MRRLPRWNAVRLYQEHTADQLTALAEQLRSDPANANPSRKDGRGSIWLYDEATHRKLAAIAQAVTWHIADAKVVD